MTATVALVGTGRMARIRATALREADPGTRLVVLSRSLARAQAFVDVHGGTAVDREELAGLSVDGVIVTSGTADHEADTLAVLGLGVPVLCEKPLAGTVDAARSMAHQAQALGTPLFVAFHRRFDPGYAALRAAAVAGELGRIYQLRATSYDATPGAPEFIRVSGGIFRDLFVHDIESAIWTTGLRVERVFATGTSRVSTDYADAGDSDVATALLWMSDGLVVTLHGLRHDPLGQDVRMEVVSSRTSAAVGLGPRTPVNDVAGAQVFEGKPFGSFEERFAEAFTKESAAFLALLKGEADFRGCTAQEALDVQVVAEACETSRTSGAPVDVPTA